jgi:RNA-directed DNA polymerase
VVNKAVGQPHTSSLRGQPRQNQKFLRGQPHTSSLRGQPIGNLTSQLFANIYLNQLDQFVKHTLGEPFYIRYMDDFLIIHASKKHLRQVQTKLTQFAHDELALELHPKKTNVHKFRQTERFVGYNAGLFVRRLSKPTVQRFLRRMKRLARQPGQASKVQTSWQQFTAYSSFAHAKGLMSAISPTTEGDSRNGP